MRIGDWSSDVCSSELVAAFDPLTGKKLWEFETELAVNHTPAWWDGTLCIAEMGGRIIGLNAKTGSKKWEHHLIDKHGRYLYGAPAAADGFFYAGVMRRMAKIEAESRSEESRVGKACVSTLRYRW